MGEIINSIVDNTCTELTLDVDTVRAYCFYQNSALTKFVDTNIVELNPFAFAYSGITNVNFPNLTDTGAKDHVFAGCTSLVTATIGTTMTILPNYFFSECSILNKVNGIDHIKTFNEGCLQRWSDPGNNYLSSIHINLNEGERATFGGYAFAGQLRVSGLPNSICEVTADDCNYKGLTSAIPMSTTSIDVYEPFETINAIAIDAEHAVTIIPKENDMVIVESTGKPYILKNGSWIDYIPSYSADYTGDSVVDNNKMRSLGFKVHSCANKSFQTTYGVHNQSNILFIIVDKDFSDNNTFSVFNCTGLKYLRFEQQDGTLTNVYPFSSVLGLANGTGAFTGTDLPDIDFSNVSSINQNSFKGVSGRSVWNFSNVTFIQGGNYDSGGTTFKSDDTEEMYFGDGTKSLTIDGCGIWRSNNKLYKLGLNCTNVVAFTGVSQTGATTGYYTNTLTNQLSGTPIYWYKGTTTTEIVENANTNPILIYGNSYTALENDIVTYNGNQYQFINNKWVLWGSNKMPKVIVPSSLVNSYISDLSEVYERWGNLNSEVYYTNVTSSIQNFNSIPDVASPVRFFTDVSLGDYSNQKFILGIVTIDTENASNIYAEIYNNDVLQDTIQITGPCKLFDSVVTANDRYTAKLYWTGTMNAYWNVISCANP